jgi:hypothetical protein
MRPWMKGAGQAYAVRHYLGVDANVWPVLESNPRRVFHFGGARRRAVIELLARRVEVGSRVRINEWFLELDEPGGPKPAWLVDASPAALALSIDSRLEHLERVLGRPFSNKRLPRAVRVDEVTHWLALEEEVEAIRSSVWMLVLPGKVREGLEVLAGSPSTRK